MQGGVTGGLETLEQCGGLVVIFLMIWVFGNLLFICKKERKCSVWPLLEAISPLAESLYGQKQQPEDVEGQQIGMLEHQSDRDSQEGVRVEEVESVVSEGH